PLPTLSVTHFLVKLVFAAPLSFLSVAWVSHAFWASVSHFFMKLVSAAPASFLSDACALHEGLMSGGEDGVLVWANAAPASATQSTARDIVFMFGPPGFERSTVAEAASPGCVIAVSGRPSCAAAV